VDPKKARVADLDQALSEALDEAVGLREKYNRDGFEPEWSIFGEIIKHIKYAYDEFAKLSEAVE